VLLLLPGLRQIALPRPSLNHTVGPRLQHCSHQQQQQQHPHSLLLPSLLLLTCQLLAALQLP
jgi:hypothetical protein